MSSTVRCDRCEPDGEGGYRLRGRHDPYQRFYADHTILTPREVPIGAWTVEATLAATGVSPAVSRECVAFGRGGEVTEGIAALFSWGYILLWGGRCRKRLAVVGFSGSSGV